MASRAGPYGEAFYEDQVEGAARSAGVVLPLLFAISRPERVIDVGCGQGAWLAAAEAAGARELTGLDGEWVDRAKLRSPRIVFHPTDLAQPLPAHARHDLCISVEVAEHLPPARSRGFVADLCRLSDVVLFSAAVPMQGGTDHVNEQRASAWIARFAEEGYDCFDLLRGPLWDDERVEWWYRQNLLVFVARRSPLHTRLAAAPPVVPPRDLVHPDAFEERVRWLEGERRRLGAWVERPSLGQALRALWRACTGGRR